MKNNVDTTFKSPAILSVCTGRRGLEIGVERAVRSLWQSCGIEGWEGRDVFKPAAYVEIESIIAYNLVAQMEQRILAPTPVWTDLKTFPWQLFRDKIFLLTGGYPCQPFSTAGKQRGSDDPRHLFPFIKRGIRTIRPVCIFLENVVNHLNIGYQEVRHSLEAFGYTVEEGIFSAQEVGAPHLRKRLFILAVANAYCTKQSKRRGDLAKMLGLQEGQCKSEQRATVFGGIGSELGDTKPEGLQGENGVQKSAFTSQSSEGVGQANSFSQGLEIRQVESTRQECTTTQRSGSADRWPAPQGQYQHPWEEPRLVSRVDFTINGYDFTEDLLRMAGNAVVEQQAELAFRTLIRKFL